MRTSLPMTPSRSTQIFKLIGTLLIGILAALAAGCGIVDRPISGSGTLTSQTYAGDPFTAVEIGSDLEAELEITPDGDRRVEITIDDNLHSHLTIETVDGRLTVSSGNIAPTADLRIRIVGHLVTGLEVKEDANITAAIPQTPAIELVVVDDAEVSVEVDTEVLNIQVDHNGELDVSGQANTVNIVADNDATARLTEVTITDAAIAASNDAVVEISASGAVTGTARSDATVRTSGRASV